MKGRMKTSSGNNAARQKKGPAPRLLILCLFGLTGLCSTRLMACAPLNGWQNKEQTVNFGDVIIQRGTAPGSVFASKTVTIRDGVEDISNEYCSKSSISVNYANGWSPLNGVAATNIAGVGVRLTYRHWSSGDWSLVANQSRDIGNFNAVWRFNSSSWLIELIKTGPSSSGNLAAGTLGKVSITPSVWVASPPWTVTSLKTTGVNNIISIACSLNSTSINVPLGDISATRFTGTGLTLGDKSFDLGLNCDKDAKINVALAGTQNSDTAETSVLALTNAGQTGTAKGVGVQLLYGGTPLKINNTILLKTSSGGQETLPFSARYYQTNKLVMPGKANSSATLNITYQ
ncbi:fimbrial protein [Serratia liquefaciens]|uniref:fimbrial protein n=1 Tax=Serratia liquefaciens TaxID=614 RepID=UPI0022DDE379|nr:fimbrial protein [Serratia liquefaciens]WBL72579.1 fimbrial protein [Serratia liquefaciens]